jgi:hypothetical protein
MLTYDHGDFLRRESRNRFSTSLVSRCYGEANNVTRNNSYTTPKRATDSLCRRPAAIQIADFTGSAARQRNLR